MTLENQSDHSGVMIRVAGLDSVAVTDSTGFFSFPHFPDGTWQLEALYPFFESDTAYVEVAGDLLADPMEITLSQLLQFWIEPADTVVSMGETDDENHFRLKLWGHLTNVSDHEVTVAGNFSPWDLTAIRPEGNFANSGCDRRYGWLSHTTFVDWFVFTFEPGESIVVSLSKRYETPCFPPGQYQFYWCVSDQAYYREHFYPYSDLNWSLLKKRELLWPASLRLEP